MITCSHKMSSIDHLHSETEMLQVEDHLNLISAQYPIHRLDTENVCHHITKMDQSPREMKGTIFTRHNQTVLPLLANNKKDTLQTIHTSFVNRRGTHLSRRHQTTLSQLRSGHCKLLYSYKKRLKLNDSSSCPDCAMLLLP